jgi:hypothetical protein
VRIELRVVVLVAGLIACEEEPLGTLCDPSSKIFCRCPGGEPGKKECSAQGDAFGSCEGCKDRPDGVGGGSSSTGSAGQGGGAPLYRTCETGDSCESGFCQSGYCTVPCSKVSDCEYPVAECVPFGGQTYCMPTCKTAVDCEPFGAPQSKCGYAPAVDNWGVTTCAHWGAEHALVPDDTDCTPFEHEDCNLGYGGREKVCNEQGLCKTGCFTGADCTAASCSSDGTELGTCG